MDQCARILLYGHDGMLLKSRGMILEKVGYRVWTAVELGQLKKAPKEQPTDLCILCQSLSSDERRAALLAVRDLCPEVKVISLVWNECMCDASTRVEVLNGFVSPAAFIASVTRALDHPQSKTARQ